MCLRCPLVMASRGHGDSRRPECGVEGDSRAGRLTGVCLQCVKPRDSVGSRGEEDNRGTGKHPTPEGKFQLRR